MEVTDNSEVIAFLTKELQEWKDRARQAESSTRHYLHLAADFNRENQRLKQCCTRRGARMQIMGEFIRRKHWWGFLRKYPEAKDWFDEDGVPKQEDCL